MRAKKTTSASSGKSGEKTDAAADAPCHHTTRSGALLHRVKNCDAHHRLFIAAGVALLVALLTSGRLRLPAQVVISWDAFTFCVLTLAWIRMATAEALKCVRSAKLQDSSRTLIFLFVVASACISLFAVAYLLGSAKGLGKEALAGHVLLALVTVVGSWLLIHTMFALRYAHTFYGDHEDPEVKSYAGGLEFPGEKTPDYLDFAYFAFVIGMTCQVSDVQITDRGIRLQVLLHGLLSFAFNAVILALSINIVSGLFTS